jgi:hypothetical protein
MYSLARASDSQNTNESVVSSTIYGNINHNISSSVPSSCGQVPFYNEVLFTLYDSETGSGALCFFTQATEANKICWEVDEFKEKSSNYFWHKIGEDFSDLMNVRPYFMLCAFGPVHISSQLLVACISQQ